MKLKVGDRVRIKNERGKHWNDKGRMDIWMGKEVTINEINGEIIHIKEDAGEFMHGELEGWSWRVEDFEPVDRNGSLTIFQKGRETIGILRVNGKEIRRAVAKCHKEDTYISRQDANW